MNMYVHACVEISRPCTQLQDIWMFETTAVTTTGVKAAAQLAPIACGRTFATSMSQMSVPELCDLKLSFSSLRIAGM